MDTGGTKIVDLGDYVPPEWRNLPPVTGTNAWPFVEEAIKFSCRVPFLSITGMSQFPGAVEFTSRLSSRAAAKALSLLEQAPVPTIS